MQRTALLLLLFALLLTACGALGKGGDVYAWNYPQAIDSGGVAIQIGRVLIAKPGAFDDEFLKGAYFQDKATIAELIFVVKNNTGQSMNVYPDQGHVVANGEQVNLLDAALVGSGGDPLGGEILPGVTKVGTLWFGFRRSSIEDLQAMTIVLPAPHDNYLYTTGQEYRFDLDLSNRKNESLPDELK